MQNLEMILAKHPFFHGIPDEYIRSIAEHVKIVQFKEGDVLFKEGGDADKFYLIIKGKITIEIFVPNRGVITIQTVEDGEILGWSWFVAPYKWRFSATVLKKTEMIALNGEELHHLCEKEPRLGYELMKRMVQAISLRLEHTRLLVLDIYGKRSK